MKPAQSGGQTQIFKTSPAENVQHNIQNYYEQKCKDILAQCSPIECLVDFLSCQLLQGERFRLQTTPDHQKQLRCFQIF